VRRTRPADDAATGSLAGSTSSVELFWIPLGAGNHVVRLNGIAYEAIVAARQRRPRARLLHSALVVRLPGQRYTVEMTPVPDADPAARGVVRRGPVALRSLGRWRLFRYEVRCWPGGVVPDLGHAVASPVLVADDGDTARRVLELLPTVPALVWGRDEARTGEMWTCNSIISWALTVAGIDVAALPLPPAARAPGWDAGRRLAQARAGEYHRSA
jgi:hypothetical protein